MTEPEGQKSKTDYKDFVPEGLDFSIGKDELTLERAMDESSISIAPVNARERTVTLWQSMTFGSVLVLTLILLVALSPYAQYIRQGVTRAALTTFGTSTPYYAESRMDFAQALFDGRQKKAAVRELSDTARICERDFGKNDVRTVYARIKQAKYLIKSNKSREAARIVDAQIPILKDLKGKPPKELGQKLFWLAADLQDRNRLKTASNLFMNLVPFLANHEQYHAVNAPVGAGMCEYWLDNFDEAEPILRLALDRANAYGKDYKITIAKFWLAKDLNQLGKFDEAEKLLGETLVVSEKLYASGDKCGVNPLKIKIEQGRSLAGRKRYAEAEALLKEVGQELQSRKGFKWAYNDSRWALANTYRDQGRLSEANRIYRDTIKRIQGGQPGPYVKKIKRDMQRITDQG